MTKRLVHSELQKLRSNRTFWIMTAILTALSVLYVFMQTDTFFKVSAIETEIIGTSIDLVKEGPTIFWKIIRDSSMVAWFSVPFAGLLIGTDFGDRGISQTVMAGSPRGKLFLIKAIEYYVLFLLVLSIYPVGAFLRCCLPWVQVMSAADAAYFWQGVFLKLVLDLNLISIGFFLVFLCRDVLKSIAASLGVVLLLAFFPRIPVGENIRSINPVSYYSYIVRHPDPMPGSMWDVPPLSTVEISVIVIGSFLVIAACITGAYLLFRKSELR